MRLVLNETLEDIKKYYPNVPDNIFMKLITLDPTYRIGSDSAGKYGKWILNLYNRDKIDENDFDEVTPLLNQFITYRNRITNKDLNSYKTLQDLSDVLGQVIDDDSMLTPNQKNKFLKKVKSGKVKSDKSNDYDVVLDTPNFIVYVPNTHEASMNLGKGTEWCTAHENPEHYNSYTEDGGKLYIIKDKKSGERWQYSDRSRSFLDQNDEEFDVITLLKSDEALSKFFAKFLGTDFCNFDGTWIYDGKIIPDYFKNNIKYIVITDKVKRIKNGEFYAFTNLKTVVMSNNVTSIGENAFENCINLSKINISKNVIDIGESAFWGCESLTKIIIPNSVIEIGRNAFENCTDIKSITIPNSVTKIGHYAFNYCDNLTIYTDNEYVIDYCEDNYIEVKSLSAKNESYKMPNALKLQIRE